jgi:hypothetical protein
MVHTSSTGKGASPIRVNTTKCKTQSAGPTIPKKRAATSNPELHLHRRLQVKDPDRSGLPTRCGYPAFLIVIHFSNKRKMPRNTRSELLTVEI